MVLVKLEPLQQSTSIGRGAPSGDLGRGRPADVKSDTYWVLARSGRASHMGENCYSLRPVSSWYDFTRDLANNGEGSGRSRLEQGEAELRREWKVRIGFVERWEKMLANRAARQGGTTIRGQILRDLHRRQHPSEDHEGQALDGDDAQEKLGAFKSLGPLQALRALEALEEVYASGQQTGIVAAATEVAWPEEGRLKDDTGIEEQRRKLIKTLKRKADAIEKAEDDDVPVTANALLQLKSERGEGLWDFADHEEYSDDEQEKDNFDEQLGWHQDDLVLGAIVADEGNAELGDDDQLTHHGQVLFSLLEKHGDAATSVENFCYSGISGETSAEKLGETKQTYDRAETKHVGGEETKSSVAVENLAGAAVDTVVAVAKPNGSTSRNAVSSPSASPKNPRPCPTAASDRQQKNEPTTDCDVIPSDRLLRERTVACLQRHGGACTLGEVAAALGLRSPKSALYREAVAVLRQVANACRVPREARPLLVLKAEFWEGSALPEGPCVARGCCWSYADTNGNHVPVRELAECCGPKGQELFRIAVTSDAPEGNSDRNDSSLNETRLSRCEWLPVSRAPLCSPQPTSSK